jgi:hypothetical protein
MDSKTLTLDDLTNLYDDIDAADVAADETPENTGVPALTPPHAGKYQVRLTSIDVDRDQNGDIRDKLNFNCDLTIAEGPLEGRKVRFIKISGKSKTRKVKGVDMKYTELVDLVHGFDPDFNVQNSPDRAVRFLLERINDNSVASVQLDWKAFDTKHFNAQNGDTLQDGSAEKKALFKACAIRGQKNFESDGTLINPASGNALKARAYVKWVYVPTRSTV